MQRNPLQKDLSFFKENLNQPVLDLSEENVDLEAMLAICHLLNHYIGVSNTNMHLRASVGGTASVLVPHPAEWRWMLHEESSAWFPEFKIYRQDANFSWDKALKKLSENIS